MPNKNKHIENCKDCGADIIKNSAEAVSESFNSTNFNDTKSFIPTLSCVLCFKMVKYNIVPLTTLALCTVCTAYTGAATYKSIKTFIKDPSRGLP